jgi:hypothetical protein
MSSSRRKTPWERRLVSELGPTSSSFSRWKETWGSFDDDGLFRFDPSLEEAEAEDCVVRGYLIALARGMLLREIGRERLSAAEWFGGWKQPDWESLDAWVEQGPARMADEMLDQAGWHQGDAWERASFDLLTSLQEVLLRSIARKREGEFYTPAWLADRVVEEVWKSQARWLDPTSGGGAFIRAIARQARIRKEPMPEVAGFDRSPFGVLSTAAALATAHKATNAIRPLAVGLVDLLASDETVAARFDRLVGNPPWVLWDSFDREQRMEMGEVWDSYSLRLETGMASILGGGKRDISFLVLLRSMDRWLDEGGRGAFVVPQSLFKSTTAGRGLRRWQQPSGTPLSVDLVEDLSRLRPFPNASVKSAIVYITVGKETRYPVDYRVWRRVDGTKVEQAWASPSDPSDPLSHWRHDFGRNASIPGEGVNVWGKSAYQARLGANVGGASGIFWLRRMEKIDDALWRMANLSDRGRRAVPAREVVLESSLIYPALLGKDVRAWHAEPSAWLLLTQDPEGRRGWEIDELSRRTPRVLGYLAEFEAMLRERAAFKRFFQRVRPEGERIDLAPYYSMFNVGTYTLAPIKVVWNRMGRRLSAAVVTESEGKPIVPQETHSFAVVDSVAEGDYLSALLNSRPVRTALEEMHVVSSKSLATPRVIHSLGLVRFDPENALHQSLSRLGREARESARQGMELRSEWESEYHSYSLEFWSIRSSE